MGCFVERRARQLIATSADPPLNIGFSGLVASWRQAQMSAHIPRLLESFWLVDRRPESQRRHRTDARRAHQSSADRFVPDDDEHLLGQPGELAQHRGEDFEQRIDHHRQALLSSDKFAGANNEVLARGSSKFQAGLSKDGSSLFGRLRSSTFRPLYRSAFDISRGSALLFGMSR